MRPGPCVGLLLPAEEVCDGGVHGRVCDRLRRGLVGVVTRKNLLAATQRRRAALLGGDDRIAIGGQCVDVARQKRGDTVGNGEFHRLDVVPAQARLLQQFEKKVVGGRAGDVPDLLPLQVGDALQ